MFIILFIATELCVFTNIKNPVTYNSCSIKKKHEDCQIKSNINIYQNFWKPIVLNSVRIKNWVMSISEGEKGVNYPPTEKKIVMNILLMGKPKDSQVTRPWVFEAFKSSILGNFFSYTTLVTINFGKVPQLDRIII